MLTISRSRMVASKLATPSGSVSPSNAVDITSPYKATASYAKIDSDGRNKVCGSRFMVDG